MEAERKLRMGPQSSPTSWDLLHGKL